MSDDTALYTAVGKWIAARRNYNALAAHALTHPLDADTRARAELAYSAVERAADAVEIAWDAAHADPIPALLARLEAVASTGVAAQQAAEALSEIAATGATLEEAIVGARYVLAEEGES